MLLGCDLTRLDAFDLNLLTNDEVLAIDQDPSGQQARRVVDRDGISVWKKTLADGSIAIGIFNLDEDPRDISVTWSDLGITGPQQVRDLWRQQDLGLTSDQVTRTVARHGVSLLRLSKP